MLDFLSSRSIQTALKVKKSASIIRKSLCDNLAFKHQQRRYGRGTLIINVHSNDPTIHDVMQRLATETSAEIVAVDDSWVSEGPNFGSGNVIIMQAPKIALLWDEPTNAYSAGSTRYLLARTFE